MASIQWYPGHMTKTNRQLLESIKQVDIVVEVLDARIPRASSNPDIAKMLSGRQRLIVLNKSDLADASVSAEWKHWFSSIQVDAVFTDSKTGVGFNAIKTALKRIGAEKVRKHAEKGVVQRSVRAMIVGIPNSGKSTLINRLAGKATAKTGDRPGVTRARQWVRLEGGIDLLDTPGILWPKFDDEEVARNLAFTGAIKDDIIDTITLSEQLLEVLLHYYPEKLGIRYNLVNASVEVESTGIVPAVEETLDADPAMKFPLLCQVGKRRGFLLSGGRIDLERTATMVFDEFRAAKLGRISLERPELKNTDFKYPDSE